MVALRHPNTPMQAPTMPSGRNTLRDAQKECMTHSPTRHITCHLWRHIGAAAFQVLGGTEARVGPLKAAKAGHALCQGPSLLEATRVPLPTRSIVN